jgi:transcriptional regulator with XRE-family HTH domain
MKISDAREMRGFTQMDLAKRMGVTQGAVSQWETGTSLPRADLLPKLADVLGCTVDELLRPADKKENPA